MGSFPSRYPATLLLSLFVAAQAACDSASTEGTLQTDLVGGTWGGENAGVLVGDATVHVHIGCTLGNFLLPITLDADRRFTVSGEYLLRAYPVAIGPTLPAQFSGVLRFGVLTMTVAVNDTINDKQVVLGPVTVMFGREPRMGPCPICRDERQEPD